MELTLLLPMVLASLGAVVLYTLIGFVPGTDETSVLLPVTLTLVLAGVEPQVVLAFFIAAVITPSLPHALSSPASHSAYQAFLKPARVGMRAARLVSMSCAAALPRVA